VFVKDVALVAVPADVVVYVVDDIVVPDVVHVGVVVES
jgi:hypothetical protein